MVFAGNLGLPGVARQQSWTGMTHAKKVDETLVLIAPTGAPGPAFSRELKDLDAGGGTKLGLGCDRHIFLTGKN